MFLAQTSSKKRATFSGHAVNNKLSKSLFCQFHTMVRGNVGLSQFFETTPNTRSSSFEISLNFTIDFP